MKALIGTAAVAVLVFAACDTPAPQRVAGPPTPSASRELVLGGPTPDPLVIIDGIVQKGAPADSGVETSVSGQLQDRPADARPNGVLVRGAASPSMKGILSRIVPDSIASVEVLKGNAATAKYGARARNGVIIITTKGAARDTLHM